MSTVNSATLQELKDIANKLRIDSINSTNAGGSGHPTSCCSAAEIMSVLFFNVMRYRIDKPRDPASDRFIMSKGHAAPILYAAWAEAGLFPVSDLLTLRKNTSIYEGHPTPRLDFIDVGTGSLGQGLSIACGMAYSGKYLEKDADYRTYCLIGDGESAEGSIWEACAFASYYKLDNLVAIFDVNRLGQSQETALQHDMDVFRRRLDGFGFAVCMLEDGHSVEELVKAFHTASQTKGKPTAIVAKTLKGKGIPGIENELNWHGKPLGDKAAAAIEAISAKMSSPNHTLKVSPPANDLLESSIAEIKLCSAPDYKLGDKVATRVAYGLGLKKIGENNTNVVALDGDTKNSSYACTFQKAYPERFIECFIAEQNMVGVSIGVAARNRKVTFASTFACFLSRAYDQIRMGAISETNANFCGSHAGVSIGEDGASQMALEDLAMFRAIPGSTVFYPSDAVSCERAVELCANTKGICFIRTSRPATPVLYTSMETFVVGKAKIVHQTDDDKVTLIGAGITMEEGIKAYDSLKKKGINVRVIDPFTIKPLDKETILASAKDTGGKIVIVEDHYPQGGIGEAVAGALAGNAGIVIKHLAVQVVPRSGDKAFLLDLFGISAKHIEVAINEILA